MDTSNTNRLFSKFVSYNDFEMKLSFILEFSTCRWIKYSELSTFVNIPS